MTKGKKEKLGVYDEREKSEIDSLPLIYQILKLHMNQKSFASYSITYPWHIYGFTSQNVSFVNQKNAIELNVVNS